MNLFQRNIEKWSETDPKRALMLPYLHFKKSHLLPKESEQETKSWFHSLDLKETKALFVYGVASGNYYQIAKKWLEKGENRLIFLEDDLEAIYALFQTDAGNELLHDPKVSLYYFDNIGEISQITLALRWEFFMKKIQVSAIKSYEKEKNEIYQELQHRIYNDQSLHNSLVQEYLEYGAAFFKNFYQNLSYLPGSYLGNALFGKFKKVPAIICGAGPSLDKQLALLKTLQDKALIFAGGSALNALVANGITPHFGAGIDPNKEQLERLKETQSVEIPFFFRNRLYHEALKLIKGPRLYIPGSGGYDISEWFENELKISREPILDEGHNVVNFEVEIAHALGCSPIIFVGMDLGFTNMLSYASGIVKEPRVTKKAILKEGKNLDSDDFDLRGILKKDIYGKPLYTLWKWIIESEWMGDFLEEHPKALLINATEGGLGFPSVKNENFKSVYKRYLNKSYPLKKRIAAAIKIGSLPKITTRKVNLLIKKISKSLTKCSSYLDILLEEIEVMSNKIKSLKKLEPSFSILSGRAALFESDLFEEDAYKYILAVFSEAFAGIINHEMRNLRKGNLSEKKKALKKLELNKQRLTFLKIVAEVNLEIIRMTGST